MASVSQLVDQFYVKSFGNFCKYLRVIGEKDKCVQIEKNEKC